MGGPVVDGPGRDLIDVFDGAVAGLAVRADLLGEGLDDLADEGGFADVAEQRAQDHRALVEQHASEAPVDLDLVALEAEAPVGQELEALAGADRQLAVVGPEFGVAINAELGRLLVSLALEHGDHVAAALL